PASAQTCPYDCASSVTQSEKESPRTLAKGDRSSQATRLRPGEGHHTPPIIHSACWQLSTTGRQPAIWSQKSGDAIGSPPARVPSACQSTGSILSWMKRTLPSAKPKFTPPGCRLEKSSTRLRGLFGVCLSEA